jgi:hypothetical protein
MMTTTETAIMKTQAQIEDKVTELQGYLDEGIYSDPMQNKSIIAEVWRLKWVLGVGSDRIAVPKP